MESFLQNLRSVLALLSDRSGESTTTLPPDTPHAPLPNDDHATTQQILAAIQQLQEQLGTIQQQLGTIQQQLAVSQPAQPAPPASPDSQTTPNTDQEQETSSVAAEPVTESAVEESLVSTGSSRPLVLLTNEQAMTEPAAEAGAAEAKPIAGFLPNGIDGISGQPLLRIDTPAANSMADATLDPPALRTVHTTRQKHDKKRHLGVVYGISPDKLEESRWAIVVNSEEDAAILKALVPLIEHRSAQQGISLPPLSFRDGETCGAWVERYIPNYYDAAFSSAIPWQQCPPVLLYQPGEQCIDWLANHNVTHGPVDPARGVPFYLLLVGRPGPLYLGDLTAIPYSFQYELDMFWGVGRLCFNDAQGEHILSAYTEYAEQVVAFEQASSTAALTQTRHITYFGTYHDQATRMSVDELLTPLIEGHSDQQGIALRSGFTQHTVLGKDATHAALYRLFSGTSTGPLPSLLVSATHGIGLPAEDPRTVMNQGALLCQDWSGPGSDMKRDYWFAADDLSHQARVTGLIALCFACYSAGCPQEDTFVVPDGRRSGGRRPIIAPYAFVAQLPQQMLRRGALAVLGHIDRAWSHSFNAPGVPAQSQAFEDVLARIMSGKRLGYATDQFNMRQGALSTLLANEIESRYFGKQVHPNNLAMLWVARNDARNYALLGDPAVRLPFSAT